MRRAANTGRFPAKNFYKAGNRKTKAENANSNLTIFNKYERRNRMKKLNLINNHKKAISVFVLSIIVSLNIIFTGCGDSDITGYQNSASVNTAAGESNFQPFKDSTIIRLDINIKFKSESITNAKLLESNNGNKFNNIVSFSRELNPGGELDLQELQQSGIFGLYISSEGSFTLSNSDGMSFSTKTVLMEKCSFIDLKVRNNEQSPIKVSGFVAGE